MTNLTRVAALVFVVLAFSFGPSGALAHSRQTWAAHTDAHYVPDQLIVQFKPGVNDSAIRSVYARHGVREKENLHRQPGLEARGALRLVEVPAGKVPEFANRLRHDPRVEYAEPNYRWFPQDGPNDPRFAELWGLKNTGQNVNGTTGTAGADIDAPVAWNTTTGSSEIIVAVIDTGVDYNHPDLAANMWVNPFEIPGNGIDDDSNGYVDDIHGINAITNSGDPMDDVGHGTHVAGTIGAVGNNGIGVTGVNWNVRIIAVKFLSPADGTTADAVKSFQYINRLKNVQGIDIRVSNNSWGGGGNSQALREAMAGLDQPGMEPILHVAAAGNSASDNDAAPTFPASYTLGNLVTVAASDQRDAYATFSNRGVNSVDLAAPGVNILSTVPTAPCELCDPSGYKFLDGTSMAAPHVSGGAALLWAANPALNFNHVRARLIFSGDSISPAGTTFTDKRLNTALALTVPNDMVAPGAISNLQVTSAGLSSITVNFAVSGDDGMTGNASALDVRFSTAPLNEANWHQYFGATSMPKPASPGTGQSVTLSALSPATTYHIGVRLMDEAGNLSPLVTITASTQTGTVLLFEDAETTNGNWNTDPQINNLWHRSNRRAQAGSTSWYFGQETTGTVGGGGIRYSGRLYSPGLNVSGATSVLLEFDEFVDLGSKMTTEIGVVAMNQSGPTINDIVANSDPTNGAWVHTTLDLTSLLAGTTGKQIWFGFSSCGSFDFCDETAEGWYIDDIGIRILGTGRSVLPLQPSHPRRRQPDKFLRRITMVRPPVAANRFCGPKEWIRRVTGTCNLLPDSSTGLHKPTVHIPGSSSCPIRSGPQPRTGRSRLVLTRWRRPPSPRMGGPLRARCK